MQYISQQNRPENSEQDTYYRAIKKQHSEKTTNYGDQYIQPVGKQEPKSKLIHRPDANTYLTNPAAREIQSRGNPPLKYNSRSRSDITYAGGQKL